MYLVLEYLSVGLFILAAVYLLTLKIKEIISDNFKDDINKLKRSIHTEFVNINLSALEQDLEDLNGHSDTTHDSLHSTNGQSDSTVDNL